MNIYGHTLLWELVKGGKYISKDACCESSKRVKTLSRMEMASYSDCIRILKSSLNITKPETHLRFCSDCGLYLIYQVLT